MSSEPSNADLARAMQQMGEDVSIIRTSLLGNLENGEPGVLECVRTHERSIADIVRDQAALRAEILRPRQERSSDARAVGVAALTAALVGLGGYVWSRLTGK